MSAKLPSWNELYHLGLLARDAYSRATITNAATDTQVWISGGPFSIVVAFRGSSSVRDWLTNAQFGMEDLFWATDDHCARVHRGFLEAFESVNVAVLAAVRELLQKFPSAEIYITGHSLGGALAMLAAYEFRRLKLPLAEVVTFGAPRVGNKAFAAAYNSAPVGQTFLSAGSPDILVRAGNSGQECPDTRGQECPRYTLRDITFNFVVQGDPIPLVPTLLMGYRDCGTEYFIKRSGELLVDPWIGAELFTDLLGTLNAWRTFKLGAIPNHNLAHYLERISKLA